MALGITAPITGRQYFWFALGASCLLPIAFGVLLAGLVNAYFQFFYDRGMVIALAFFSVAFLVPISFGSYLGKMILTRQSFLARYAPLFAPVFALLLACVPATLALDYNYVGLETFCGLAVLCALYGVFYLAFVIRCRGCPTVNRVRGAGILLALFVFCCAAVYGTWHYRFSDMFFSKETVGYGARLWEDTPFTEYTLHHKTPQSPRFCDGG